MDEWWHAAFQPLTFRRLQDLAAKTTATTQQPLMEQEEEEGRWMSSLVTRRRVFRMRRRYIQSLQPGLLHRWWFQKNSLMVLRRCRQLGITRLLLLRHLQIWNQHSTGLAMRPSSNHITIILKVILNLNTDYHYFGRYIKSYYHNIEGYINTLIAASFIARTRSLSYHHIITWNVMAP